MQSQSANRGVPPAKSSRLAVKTKEMKLGNEVNNSRLANGPFVDPITPTSSNMTKQENDKSGLEFHMLSYRTEHHNAADH